MLTLFAVLLGGRAAGCNTELHDVVFVVGEKLEDTYPQLIHKWFGVKKSLHIDGSIALRYVDGYEISISKLKPAQDLTLFFVNFGGYQANYFGEIHHTGFYIATDKKAALAKAKHDLSAGLSDIHCDDNISIDEIIGINTIDNYYLHFEPTSEKSAIKIVSKYCPLDTPEILNTEHLPSP